MDVTISPEMNEILQMVLSGAAFIQIERVGGKECFWVLHAPGSAAAAAGFKGFKATRTVRALIKCGALKV